MNGLSALMFDNVTLAAFRITQNFSGDLTPYFTLFHWRNVRRDDFIYTVTSEQEVLSYDSHLIRQISNHNNETNGMI
jgi:hypothetical protein